MSLALLVPLALRFSLDSYTSWWNSPSAALYFWGFFFIVVAVIVGATLWVFRSMRPH